MKSITFKSKNSSNVSKFLSTSNAKLKAKGKSIELYSITLSPKGFSSATIFFY